MGILSTLEHGWSLFKPWGSSFSNEVDTKYQYTYEPHSLAPDNSIPQRYYSRASFASMLYNRIAMDVSSIKYMHVKNVPETDSQEIVKDSSLQRIFDVEANIDQTSTDFFHDLVYSLFDEGVVAVVITEATLDPSETGMYDIKSLRVGKILDWYPTKVRVKVYNENKGDFSEIVVDKRMTAIIENPLNNILGNNNPTLDRLLNKLSLLDKKDADAKTNKLNIILQLPHPVRHEIKNDVAKTRVRQLEDQIKSSDLGIGYIGSEEKIIQTGQHIKSSLLEEIQYLTDELLSQMGVTRKVFDGTADAAEMQNYYSRTIEPIAARIQEEFQRKFITRTAYTQGHRIVTHSDPFKLVPTEQLATIGDTLLRNSILTPNEFRSIIGYGPSSNPLADELYNRNIADANQTVSIGSPASPEEVLPEEQLQNGGENLMEEPYDETV